MNTTAAFRTSICTKALVFCTAISALFIVPAWAADTVTGTIQNATTNKPSAGDDVVLLRLTEGMLQEGATKTDARGAFTLELEFLNSPHLLRVVHQGVNYDQAVTPGMPVTMSVFDAVSKIKNLHGSIGVIQLASDGKTLEVSELYGIENTSNPPRTQASPRNFDFHVPQSAELISVMVAGPAAKIGVRVEPSPVEDDKGHYTLNFPLKPGQTKYLIKYHLPYNGRITFHPRLPYSFQEFGVMIPESMTFTPLLQNSFHDGDHRKGFRIYAARNVKAGEASGFEIAGVGMIPSSGPANASDLPDLSTIPTGRANDTPATPAIAIPGHTSNSAAWVILTGCAVLVIVSISLIWRAMKRPHGIGAKGHGAGTVAVLEAFKAELFELEIERTRGSISADEYTTGKAGLLQNIQRSLAKQPRKNK